MFAYYDAQADSYEDFYRGHGQAIGPLAAEYPVDTVAIQMMLSSFGGGNVVDLACGTGFWLTAYGANCERVTLVDQSADALTYCQRRVESLGLAARAHIVRGDVFDVPLDAATYDACLVGFLLSHLTDPQIDLLFERIRTILRARASLAIIDSAWTEARRAFCQREGFVHRTLVDGRAFTIRKRYFDQPELEALLSRQGFQVTAIHVGAVFIGARAIRRVTLDAAS